MDLYGRMASWHVVCTIIQGLITLNYPTYGFERWHGTLLVWAVTLFCVIFNTANRREPGPRHPRLGALRRYYPVVDSFTSSDGH